MSDISNLETAILRLQNTLLELGIRLEHIKVDKPLYIDGKEVATLHGIGIKSIIYEDDATHWRA